jgi:hypothetical protein
VAVRTCVVSYEDARGIRHGVEVEAESVYEAAVLGIRALREDPWLEPIGTTTMMEIALAHSEAKHAVSVQQIENWLARPAANMREASKKAKLKMVLVQG